MKKALIFLLVAFSVAFAAITATAFKGETRAEMAAFAAPSAPRLYSYEFSLDTITNAANDTLALPATDVQSNYEWAYFITRTSISGTANIAVAVQASGVRSGNTDWTQVGVTSATTATNEVVGSTTFHGRRHRIIVDGTGTQSTSYKITAVLKLKN
jgi:hypothetical protein